MNANFVQEKYPWAARRILWHLSHLMTKPTEWPVRPAKTQISLCSVRSESSLCAKWVADDPVCLHANSEDSDQTGRTPRLIWVFAGRTGHFVGFVMRWLKYHFDIISTAGDNRVEPRRSVPEWIQLFGMWLGKGVLCLQKERFFF